MEANELQAQIAYELANDAAFIAFCTTLVGAPLKVIVGIDPEEFDPSEHYPCVAMTVKQQSSDKVTLQDAIHFTVILESTLQLTEVDGYWIYSDSVKPEKISKEIYGLVKKLCKDELSYFYEVPDVFVPNNAVAGNMQLTASDTLNIGEKAW